MFDQLGTGLLGMGINQQLVDYNYHIYRNIERANLMLASLEPAQFPEVKPNPLLLLEDI